MSGLFGAREVAGLRAFLAEASPDTATVRRYTPTADGMGGHRRAYATVATVACLVQPSNRTPREVGLAGGDGAAVLWELLLPYATDVRPADQIVVSTRTFEAVAVESARSFGIQTSVICLERA